jgi:hypothetical protein
VIALRGICDAELYDDFFEECGLWQGHAACTKVLADMKRERVSAGPQRVAFEQRAVATSVLIRVCVGKPARRGNSNVVQLHAHSGGGTSGGNVENMRRQSCHFAGQ